MKKMSMKNTSLLTILLVLCILSLSPVAHAQMAEGKCRFLGNVIATSIPSDYTLYWNQVTPENSGKWGSVEATRDVMNWSGLDNAYNFAKNNGFPFKQHTFVWGQQQPNWIATLPPEEQREEVEEWIKSYCERYPDTDYIDVVNEPFHATPVYDQALGSGWNWVIWSFQKARQYCPNAKLVLNDYNIISNSSATDAYIGLINLLKAENLIDIIGEQGHFLETTDNALIKSNLDKLHATGIPIHISEYDVNIADAVAQRDKYSSQFPVLWTHPGVQGITLWGYQQGAIWRPDAYLINSLTDGSKRPALVWLENYIQTAPGGTFCITTSINEDVDTGFSLYPNPTHDGNVRLEIGQGKHELVVKDLYGRHITRMEVSGGEPVLLRLPTSSNVYILQVSTLDKTYLKKIIVN